MRSVGKVLTLYLGSGSNNEFYGPELTVTLFDVSDHSIELVQAAGGNLTSDFAEASQGQVVHLTASPAAGYVLAGVSVVDASGNPVEVSGGQWYSKNEATFVMPFSNVTVTPVFSDDLANLSVNIPSYDGIDVNVPAGVTSFKVYDDGGKDGNYSSYMSGLVRLIPADGGKLQLNGSLSASDAAYLWIYDNTRLKDDRFYGNADGLAVNIGPTIYAGDTLVVIFSSNGLTAYSGVDLEVSTVSAYTVHSVAIVNPSEGGTLTADYSEAMSGVTVSVTPTPDDRYLLTGVSVKDADGIDVAVSYPQSTDYLGYTSASFTMPFADVSVTSEFKRDLTIDDNLKVRLSISGTKTVSIPVGARSFRVYDQDSYSSGVSGNLKLVAPDGYKMMVSGSMATNRDFKIYDGDVDAAILYTQNANSYSETTNIGEWTSSGNVMTLYHYYKQNGAYSSVGLIVDVIDTRTHFDISIAGAVGGSVQKSVNTATEKTMVTLTATPSEGYLLAGINVVDADGNTVAVTGGDWISNNTATFIMPYSNVTVTPVFTDNLSSLSVNLPDSDTLVGIVPAGVTTFKVYDNGGAESPYSEAQLSQCLELSVPSAQVLEITGSVITTLEFDSLYIYNGVAEKAYSNTSRINSAIDPIIAKNTIRFCHKKTVSGSADGFDLTVSVLGSLDEHSVSVVAADGGTLTSNLATAAPGTIVTMTANPEDGYLLGSVSVAASGVPVNVVYDDASMHGFMGIQTISFVMPNADVSVTPVFSNEYTVENLYINMPVSGTVSVPVSPAITMFKLYDDGGMDGRYSLSADGYLELVASEGHVFQLTGSVTTSKYSDDLIIYDGHIIDATLLGPFRSSSDGSARSIGTIVSTKNIITVRFKTGSITAIPGLILSLLRCLREICTRCL